MKIIIYATHSYGTFPELIKNENVVVLGYGDTWGGFIKKAKTITRYLETLPPEEIVVILDGFDSVIKKTENAEEVFKSMNCKVLISKENKGDFFKYIPDFIGKYISYKIFGHCKEGISANSGLIMGYAGYLKIIYDIISTGETDDDQRNLNQACNKIPFLKIDKNCVMFENCESYNYVKYKSKAFFCQVPGEISLPRIKRAMVEYPKYFIPEIIIFIIIIITFLYGIRKKNSK